MTKKDYRPTSGLYYSLNTADAETVPLAFDGNQRVFSVNGNSVFAALTDSAHAPVAEVSIASPTVSSSVSKSTGFTLAWDNPASAPDGLVITVKDTSASAGFSITATDDGSESISSGQLTSLTAGPIRVTVSRINYKVGQTANGRQYVIGVWSSHEVNTTLTN